MEEKEEQKQPTKIQHLKKYSTFQIVSVVLIAILVVAIIVQICVISNLKNKMDDLQNRIDKLPADTTEEQNLEDWQKICLRNIEKTES